MDKNFFTKPISLKDFDFKKINLKQLKNKKEIIIGILILIYIGVIFFVGSVLLKARDTAKLEYAEKEAKYNLLKSSLSEEDLKKNIDELDIEKARLATIVKEVNNNEMINIYNDFKNNAPIKWEKDKIDLKQASKSDKMLSEYDIYSVEISNFSGSLEQIEDFLKYIETYDKIIRVDTLSFKKNTNNSNMSGSIRLSFYFKKLDI